MSGRMISNKWHKINYHKFSSISRDQGARGQLCLGEQVTIFWQSEYHRLNIE